MLDDNPSMTAGAPSDSIGALVGTPATASGRSAAPERNLAGQSDSSSISTVADWLQARAMFVIAVGVVLILTLIAIPLHLSQDGWLALIAGRAIAEHGIPQHDYFTHMAFGVRWVDQQWLAQLLMYELTSIGGLQLLTVLYVLLTAAAFGGAVWAARTLDAEDLHVLAATLPGAFCYLATAVTIRTQGLAYPLFVATVWLLASEFRSRVRSRRAYLLFPMLVLWGNLHGSVTLGAGLGVLYGACLLVGDIQQRGIRGLSDARAWVFIVISPLTLLVTPYGLGMIHYYSVTLLNPRFSRMVTEWKPVTSIPILAVPVFLAIAWAAVTVVRALWRARADGRVLDQDADSTTPNPPTTILRRSPPLFDVLTLAVLAAGAVMAVRNITWFGLALVVLLPSVLTMLKGGRPAPLRRARINQLLALATVALSVLTAVVVLTRPTGWFTSTYPSRSIATLRSQIARTPHATILADVRYADWLIWEDPRLFSGRVAYDTSLELLSADQLEAISDLAADTANAHRVLASYPIWMLDPANKAADRALLRRPGVHVLTRNHKVIIAVHGARARS